MGYFLEAFLKNLEELVLQETSFLAHTLNEIKTLNILESNHSNNEIKMPQTEKGINTEKCEMYQVSHPSLAPVSKTGQQSWWTSMIDSKQRQVHLPKMGC